MCFPIDVRSFEAGFTRKNGLRSEGRSRLGLNPHEIVIGNVGKFVPWKRQEDLIYAAARIPADLQVTMLLAGSGPEDEQLRNLASRVAPSRVRFAGFVPPDQLPAFYATCDIYAHVSSFEPHSLSISEAIYMGLPVIVSQSCGSYGTYDDVRSGSNGLVFETGSIVALAAAAERLARGPAIRARFADASRKYAVEAQCRAHGEFLHEALIADGLLEE